MSTHGSGRGPEDAPLTPAAELVGVPPTTADPRLPYGKQPCLQCGYPISEVAGSKAAICPNCGFKDPCC